MTMTSQEGFPTPLEIKVLAEGANQNHCCCLLNAECCWSWPLLFHPNLHSFSSLSMMPFLSLILTLVCMTCQTLDYGLTERRPEASSTLFFKLDIPATPEHPTLINIYYTTRGIMTKLHHPSTGRYNELWRVSAYDSLESLAMLFEDPRTHTGKGYRDVKNKPRERGCVKCGYSKLRSEYSDDMWKGGPHKSICRQCCQDAAAAVVVVKVEGGNSGTSNEKKKLQSNNNGSNNKNGNANNRSSSNNNHIAPTVLSEAALLEHNRTTGDGGRGRGGGVDRRQFN